MKFLVLSACVLLFAAAPAFAFEPASQAALTKSAKTYQAGLNTDVRPTTDSGSPPVAEPAAVEPAAGAEAETASPDDARDTTKELQQQIRLPRKN